MPFVFLKDTSLIIPFEFSEIAANTASRVSGSDGRLLQPVNEKAIVVKTQNNSRMAILSMIFVLSGFTKHFQITRLT